MRSPGQFDHPLVVRAKAEVVAAALGNGVVPAHNVTLDLKNAYHVYQDASAPAASLASCACGHLPPQIQPIVDA